MSGTPIPLLDSMPSEIMTEHKAHEAGSHPPQENN